MSTYLTPWRYCAHSLQWHALGSQFLIFFLNKLRFPTELISSGTISHIFVANYFKELNLKLEILTHVLIKSICDLKLWSKFLVSKISHISLLERLFFTLKSSIASDWIFLWHIQEDLSFFSDSSKEEILSLYTNLKDHSWIWYILELAFLL